MPDKVGDERLDRAESPAVPTLEYDVVIPTHGRNERFLNEAISTVFSQTVPPKRVIVVVDGSPEVAASLRVGWPAISVTELATPQGGAAARGAGIKEATAEWTAFLDDDDLWGPKKQEHFAAYIADNPSCEALRSKYWTFAASDDVPGIIGQQVELLGDNIGALEDAARTTAPKNNLDYLDILGDSLGLMLEFNRGNISSTMVKTSILRTIEPVPPGTSPGDDYLLFCSVAAETEWHLVNQRLVYYRLHPAQDTRSHTAMGTDRFIGLKGLAWQRVGDRAPRDLKTYGDRYRVEIRRLLWPLLKGGHLGGYIRAYRAALHVLPRYRDRSLVLIPEPIVWHLQQLPFVPRHSWVR